MWTRLKFEKNVWTRLKFLYFYRRNLSSTPNLNFFEIHTETLGASALIYADAPRR